MEFPYKFERELGKGIDDPIIQLSKSLYGGALAAKHWFDKLSDGLTKRGFRQSALDPCLFVRSDMIVVSYVDDCIVTRPSWMPSFKASKTMMMNTTGSIP
jgi:Reverse transcriptase (RNA-dependent DNA polymerase)